MKVGTLIGGSRYDDTTRRSQAPRNRQPRRRSFNDPFSNPFFDDPFGQFNAAPPKQVKLASEHGEH